MECVPNRTSMELESDRRALRIRARAVQDMVLIGGNNGKLGIARRTAESE